MFGWLPKLFAKKEEVSPPWRHEDLSTGPFAASMGLACEYTRRRLAELIAFYDGRAKDYQKRSKAWTTWALRFAAAAGAVFTLSALGVIESIGTAVRGSNILASWPDPIEFLGPFRRDTDFGVILLAIAAFLAFYTQNRGHLRAFARYRLTHAKLVSIHDTFVRAGHVAIDAGLTASSGAADLAKASAEAMEKAHAVVDEERRQWAADMLNDYAQLLRAAGTPVGGNPPPPH
jgi:hypothetical protein